MGPEEFVFLDPSFVWVMRDVDVFLPGPNADVGLQVVDAVSNGTIWLSHQLGVPPAGVSDQWRGRQVFQPPDTGATLVLRSDGLAGGVDCRISGWKLTPP
jgi:hypothetical protein